MRQPAGIPGIPAQANGLSSYDAITNLDEGSTFGEMGVRRDGPVGVADFDPIGLTFSPLAIPKLHPYLRHHPCASRSHSCANGHDEVIGVLIAAAMTAR